MGKSGEEHPRKADQAIAVDVGHSHLLVLGVDKQKARPEISHFRLEARPSSPEAASERLRSLFKEEAIETKKVRVALKGQGVVVRFLTFPQMSHRDFSSAIRYEVEKYIPFRASEIALDFQILSEKIKRGNAEYMQVLLVAVRQSEVYDLLRIFQNADLEVELIDVSAFAYANLVEWVFPEVKEKAVGFLDIGAETSTLGILNQGLPVFIRDISFGGADILKLLKRKLNLEPEAVISAKETPAARSPEYLEVVEQGLASFSAELRLSLEYYTERVAGAVPIQFLYVGGGGLRFVPRPDYFDGEIKVPTRKMEVLSKLGIPSKLDGALIRSNEDLLLTALGLCLR